MKTTKRWSKMLKLGAFAMIAAFGMVFASCGDNSGPDSKTDAERLQGTWNYFDSGLVLNQFTFVGSNFTQKAPDGTPNLQNTAKGTFVLDEATHTLTLALTHRWTSGSWVTNSDNVSGSYSFTNDTTLVLVFGSSDFIHIKQ